MTTNNTRARACLTTGRATDADGASIVVLTFKDGRNAKLLAADYDRLIAWGISPRWCLNSNGHGRDYVRVKLPLRLGWGNNAQVSRLIVCPTMRGILVRHRDGDLLNLRADNLEEVTGRTRAKGREARCMAPDAFAEAA